MKKEIFLASLWPVTCHTDYVGKNSTFVAIKGQKIDGINYVPLALQKGARTIIADQTADISQEILDAIKEADAQLKFVSNTRHALALESAAAWKHPDQHLKIIGVTGTKGKTTTSWLLYHLLQNAGYKTALLSTVSNKIMDQIFPAELTTAQPDYLHAFFATCVKEKVEYVVMEVAAQALTLNRIDGLSFDGVIFTNYAQAHGEFYAQETEYADAKKAIVALTKPGAPIIINADDALGSELLHRYHNAISFAVEKKNVRVSGAVISLSADGITGVINMAPQSLNFDCISLIGHFNVYNILAAVSMASRLGVSSDQIVAGLATFVGVPGRLEKISLANGAFCFIDYAHNPLSFKSVLPLLRSMTDHLIVVAGAGGDRDRMMRPVMGQLMAEYADRVFITTDNPRSEQPADIIGAIYDGISIDQKNKVICETDREIAIKKAYAISKTNSIIALLGKGPDEYQIIGTVKHPFSERKIIQGFNENTHPE